MCRKSLLESQEKQKPLFLPFFLLHQFFNQVLMLGKTSVSDLSEHVFDLILELYNIDSHLLLSVLPQLEFKLKVKSLFQINIEALLLELFVFLSEHPAVHIIS